MAERILVFIPAYNCAEQIGRVIAQLRGPVADYVAGVLILDNGSTDDTVARACEAAGDGLTIPVTVARNRANYHLGGSHKAAFAHALDAGYSHVAVVHGDDQADLADLFPVFARGDHLHFDACLGARFMAGARLQGYSRFRTFGNRVFNLVFSVAAGRRIGDLGSGLNLFARRVFDDPSVTRLPDDLWFNVSLMMSLFDRKLAVAFFPMSWREEDQVSNVRLVSQAWQTLGVAAAYVFRRDWFRRADHRRQPRDDYAFDSVASFGGGA